MSITLLQLLSEVSFIIAAVLFALAIALFILLKIPRVIGDLSGATARKAINSIRQQNESNGDKAYKPSAVNASRGRLTDKISPSGKITRVNGLETSGSVGTAQLSSSKAAETTLLDETIAEPAGETTVLSQPGGETAEETTVLSGSGETTVLSDAFIENQMPVAGQTGPAPAAAEFVFTLEYEITYLSSSEIVE